MRVVLLTRPHNLQAIQTLDESHRRGLAIAAVVAEPMTWNEKRQRIKRFYRNNGVVDTVRKAWQSIASEHRLDRVATRQGRRRLDRSVAEVGARLGIPVRIVRDHNGQACESLMRELAPDLILLAGTRIIKPHIFGLARSGCLNAHTGWLPEYRGVHANFWAFLEGGKTGVTVHYVDAGVDSGAILLRRELPFVPGDTIESIELRSLELCASLIMDAVAGIQAGTLTPLAQSPEQGRQFHALSYEKEAEVRRLLRRQAAPAAHAMHGYS